MGVIAADELLRLPVRMHGIQLGRPVDVLLDPDGRRVVGLDVLCGDEVHRFLPLAAAELAAEEIGVALRAPAPGRRRVRLLPQAGPDAARAARDGGRGRRRPARGAARPRARRRRQRRAAARRGRRGRALGRGRRPPARRLRPRRLTDRRSAAVASLVPVERTLTAESPRPGLGHRARHALRRPANWIQLAKFCTVGAIGYAINLAVYKLLLDGAGLHYVVAATVLVPRRGDEQLRVEPRLDVPPGARPRRLPGPALPRRLGAGLRDEPGAARGPRRGRRCREVRRRRRSRSCSSCRVNFVGNKLWSFRRR